MDGFRAFRSRLRGIRGGEWLAAAVILALLGIILLNGGFHQETGVRTDLERRLESVLSQVDDAGKVRVLVTERQERVANTLSGMDPSVLPEIQGVLVVAEGAGELRVRLALTAAVQAVLQVDPERIEIVEMRRD